MERVVPVRLISRLPSPTKIQTSLNLWDGMEQNRPHLPRINPYAAGPVLACVCATEGDGAWNDGRGSGARQQMSRKTGALSG